MGGFYVLYLEALCRRRRWPVPVYEVHHDPAGYTALAVVNGREYQSDMVCDTEELAKDDVAMRAFMICRNFSVNEGILAVYDAVQGFPTGQPSMNTARVGRSSRHYQSSWSSRASCASSSSSGYGNGSSSGSVTSWSSMDTPDFSFDHHLKLDRRQYVSKKDATKKTEIPALLLPEAARYVQPGELTQAVVSRDREAIQSLLENDSPSIATDGYSWIEELQHLGYTPKEIADELLDKAVHGPWIFEPFDVLDEGSVTVDFHLRGCPHEADPSSGRSVTRSKLDTSSSSTETDSCATRLFMRQSLEYFCGLGGVRPKPDGSPETELGSVTFEGNDSVAIVTSEVSDKYETLQTLLRSLEQAAHVLQELSGCCDSFTFLYKRETFVELQSLPFAVFRRFRTCIAQKIDQQENLEAPLLLIEEILPWLHQTHTAISDALLKAAPDSIYFIGAQFLLLALLSYAQGHCGPIKPFFLDTPLDRVVLMGLGNLETQPDGLGLCCVGSWVELTCMGEMIGQPVFVFSLQTSFDTARLPGENSEVIPKFDLYACSEDILDTWGPGEMIGPPDEPLVVLAVSVGGGLICPVELEDTDRAELHWCKGSVPTSELKSPFSRKAKYMIGAMVRENLSCRADSRAQLRSAVPLLEELGTSPSFWELAEKQVGLGFQGGQGGIAAFSYSQTWVKVAGRTKKSSLLGQPSIHTVELDSLFGVQVSVCTGIARRVRLRDLLADLLPAYVAGLVAKPPLWKSLRDDHDILSALRELDLSHWLRGLDFEQQTTFERLVFSLLFLLRDTGIDRRSENFVIACLQPDLPIRCFRVPCKKENYWARILADSEDVATFAYVTTQCLETDRIKCRGLEASWGNSTVLLRTEVSCYEDRIDTVNSSSAAASWALKHSEAYLMGRPDAALFVQVDRPTEDMEPRLLVSLSTIPPAYLYRIYRRGRPGKPRRLKEKKTFDDLAEKCVVLVSRGKKLELRNGAS